MSNGSEIAAFYKDNMAPLDKRDPKCESDTVEPALKRADRMTAWGHQIVKVDLASFQNLAVSQTTPATTPSLADTPELTAENLSTISRAPLLSSIDCISS